MVEKTGPAIGALFNVPPHSRFGIASLVIFLTAGMVETAFIAVAMFIVAALPVGMTETFPFSLRVGIVLLVGQLIHGAGLACGVVGVWGLDQERALAAIGIATNGMILLFFLLA